MSLNADSEENIKEIDMLEESENESKNDSENEHNLKPETGLCVYLKTIVAYDPGTSTNTESYNGLACVKCEYMEIIKDKFIYQNCTENLSANFPGLLGLKLGLKLENDYDTIVSCDFLSGFRSLEQLSLGYVVSAAMVSLMPYVIWIMP